MKMQANWWVAGIAGVILAAGCASHEGAYEPVVKAGADVESRSKFVLLDPGARDSVTCGSLLERVLEDGRLEVMANVRNRLNRRIEVQINCVFKDAQGFPTEQEAAFRTLILTENATEGVKFVSLNDAAKSYTIRVRQAR